MNLSPDPRRLCLSLACVALLACPGWAQDQSYAYIDQVIRLSDPNPAGFSFYGSGRLQLPSLKLDIGSSIATDKVIADALRLQQSLNLFLADESTEPADQDQTAAELQLQMGNFLKQFETRVRLDYELDSSILGFAGTPIASVQIADRPLALGLNLGLETRGYLNAQFSKEFNQGMVNLSGSLPDILAINTRVNQLGDGAGSVISQLNQLNTNIVTLAERAEDFFENPSNSSLNQLNQVLGRVDDNVDNLIPAARQLNEVVGATSKGAQNLVDAISNAGNGGVQLSAANDLHLTLGLGGSYPVFQSQDIQVAVGAQAKLFILPVNVPLRSLNLDTDAGLMGKLEVTQVQGLNQFDQIEANIETFERTVSSIDTSLDSLEKVSASTDKVEAAISQRNLQNLSSSGTELVENGLAFTQTMGSTTSNIQQAASVISNFQSVLLNELRDVNAKGTLTTPDGAGFGMDFGVDAILYKQLRLGLLLQNPIVLWQGTERPFEGRLITTQGNRIRLQPTLDVDDEGAKKVNYTATVPLSVLLNAQYRFDDLLPRFPGLYAHGQFEYVNNGRTPALTLGLQKQWDPIGYLGLGSRLGGISPLLFLEGGLRPLQGFGLDFQLGISPTGQGLPTQGFSWLGMSRLGMYYQF